MNLNAIESLHRTLDGLRAQLDDVAGDPGDRETVLKNWESGAAVIRNAAVDLEREAVKALQSGADQPDFWQFQLSAAAVMYGIAHALKHVAAADSEQEMTTLLVMAATALTGLAVGTKNAMAHFSKEGKQWH